MSKGTDCFWFVLLFDSICEIQKVIQYEEIITQESNDIKKNIWQAKNNNCWSLI